MRDRCGFSLLDQPLGSALAFPSHCHSCPILSFLLIELFTVGPQSIPCLLSVLSLLARHLELSAQCYALVSAWDSSRDSKARRFYTALHCFIPVGCVPECAIFSVSSSPGIPELISRYPSKLNLHALHEKSFQWAYLSSSDVLDFISRLSISLIVS